MIRTNWEARSLTGPRCHGECANVLGKLTFVSKHFSDGFSRCRVCEYWLDWRFCHLTSGEKANSESIGMYCNCCNYQVRQRPHSKEAKETLRRSREQPLASKKDNKTFSEIKNSIRDSLAQRQDEHRLLGSTSKISTFTRSELDFLKNIAKKKFTDTDQPTKHIESTPSEKSLDEIREYFRKKFQDEPSLLEEFEILENYLILLPNDEKYSDINYFFKI